MGMRRQARESLVAFRTQLRDMRFPGLQANKPAMSVLQSIQPRRLQPQIQQHSCAPVLPKSVGEPDVEPTSPRVLTQVPELPITLPELRSPGLHAPHLEKLAKPSQQEVKTADRRVREFRILHSTSEVVHPKGLTVITGYDRIGNSSCLWSSSPKVHLLQDTLNHAEKLSNSHVLRSPSLEDPFQLPASAQSNVIGLREFPSSSPILSSSEGVPTPPSSPVFPAERSAPLKERSSHVQVILPITNTQEQRLGYVERCQALAEIFEESADSTPDTEDGLAVVKTSKRALQRFGNTIRIYTPVETITADREDTKAARTFGSIRYAGSDKILMSSVSGWRSRATGNPRLLDGDCWAKAVREFCRIVRHQLPPNVYDGLRKGQFAACHVEKRLGLWFIFHHIANSATGLPCREKLEHLKSHPQHEAIIEMDKAPCLDCLQFLKQLSRFTNVKFHVEAMTELGQVERYNEPGVTAITRRLVPGGYKDVATVKFNTHHLELNRTIGSRVGKSRMATLARIPWFAVQEAIDEPGMEINKDESESIVRPLRNMSLTRNLPQNSFQIEIPHRNLSNSDSEGSIQSSSQYSRGSGRRASLPSNVFSSDVLNCLDNRLGSRDLGSYRNPVMIDDSEEDGADIGNEDE